MNEMIVWRSVNGFVEWDDERGERSKFYRFLGGLFWKNVLKRFE